MKVSALYIEGVEHVQRHVDGARGEQAIAIAKRLVAGLKVARRPKDYAEGVRAASLLVLRVAGGQLLSDEKLT